MKSAELWQFLRFLCYWVFWNVRRIHRLLSLNTAPESLKYCSSICRLTLNTQLWLQLGHKVNSLIRVPNKWLLILFSCLSPPKMVNNVNNRKQNMAKAKLGSHKLGEKKAQVKIVAAMEWMRGKQRADGGICVSWNTTRSSYLKWHFPGSRPAVAGGNRCWLFSLAPA